MAHCSHPINIFCFVESRLYPPRNIQRLAFMCCLLLCNHFIVLETHENWLETNRNGSPPRPFRVLYLTSFVRLAFWPFYDFLSSLNTWRWKGSSLVRSISGLLYSVSHRVRSRHQNKQKRAIFFLKFKRLECHLLVHTARAPPSSVAGPRHCQSFFYFYGNVNPPLFSAKGERLSFVLFFFLFISLRVCFFVLNVEAVKVGTD